MSITPNLNSPTFFPQEYIMPEGSYQVLITGWHIQKLSETTNKLVLELLPLDYWVTSNNGKTKNLFPELTYKGRFPFMYLYDFKNFHLARLDDKGEIIGKEARINKLVKAVYGKLENINDYFNSFNKLVGSQIILKISHKKSTNNRTYLAFEKDGDDILSVDKSELLSLPEGYDETLNGSVLKKGSEEGENWLRLVSKDEIYNVIKYSVLPDSDYIFLIPPDNTAGVAKWTEIIKPTSKMTRDKQDIWIEYKYSFLKKGLGLFYIKKQQGNYPTDLDQRLADFEKMNLKPVSKEFLWSLVMSKQVQAEIKNYFEINKPNIT